MTTMMEIAQAEPLMQQGATQFHTNAMSYNIKRVGQRPLRFEGSELGMAMSFSPDLPFWYEVNIYRTVDQRFVTAVRLFHQAEDLQDTFQAWEVNSLDEAIERLTSYDAATDILVGPDFETAITAPSEAAAKAMQLLAKVSDIRRHYASLIGEFLYDLENG